MTNADVKLSLSKVWVLCAAVHISVRITYLVSFLPIYFLHEIGGISWLTHDDDELMLNVLRCHLTY